MLQTKLDAIRSEREAHLVAHAVDYVEFAGQRIPILSDAVKTAITRAIDSCSGVNDATPLPAILTCFDNLDAARSAINASLASPDTPSANRAPLQSLLQFVSHAKATVTLQRNLNLYAQLSQAPNANELAVVTDKILDGLRSMDPRHARHDELFPLYQARRALHVGRALLQQKEFAAAHHYLQLAASTFAPDRAQEIDSARAAAVQCRALVAMQQSPPTATPASSVDATTVPLCDRLDELYVDGPGLIQPLPPKFDCTMCKPVTYDLASQFLAYPEVEAQAPKATGGGWLNRLWG